VRFARGRRISEEGIARGAERGVGDTQGMLSTTSSRGVTSCDRRDSSDTVGRAAQHSSVMAVARSKKAANLG
jgi:hypothetical protein